ncbi:hybrid sensor histidine kinase/response regulator [Pedobacter heparinus]|uniref:histidine kinase n=1 Tax=Pedobacter heparinus (strain ATCC 13125 / DSM 2366 / CIP 104194 / JCM 7457 / NBRC 12017 / NCIMB 9290 / NRRL B-14731 / HIM 762-3) TaxID=485917 RepID=C6Y002_PEDHD|nr:ATP-binding protein [Pedobacter heparinus]ACU02697.1 ATP-binding region ATPase domain protein [Pedobacter heparinus DSM 2366]
MEIKYTKVLARNILLTFLVFSIIFAVAALFLYNNITKKLAGISELASHIDREQEKPERALILLQQAEDDFQQYLLDINSKKDIDYRKNLSLAFYEVDALLHENKNIAYLTVAQRDKMKQLNQKRLKLSKEFILLKHDFDSLLSVYAKFNDKTNSDLNGKKPILSPAKINQTDTIKKLIPLEKRSFFKRIKDAILNRDTSRATRVIEIRPKDSGSAAFIGKNTINIYGQAYAKRLLQLNKQNAKLLDMHRNLISLSIHTSSELRRINNGVREINANMAENLKRMAFKNYRETTALLTKVHLAALLLLLLFGTLLIIFIIQLNRSEQHLRKENKRSGILAQQKMDLLNRMSHEIRNPLNAIKGFLYVFSRTNLSKEQTTMIDSIKLSSDMLLQTLDDTLDASKMENSEFKINKEPFNPDLTLRKVIQNMEYGAAEKNLNIAYFYSGNSEAIVNGDSFRLKQILVNLLSNAIKYTKEGGIIVTAEMSNDKLYVAVKDTGAGISLEQQSGLFSKYYQTNSSKGQTGTGLGLFICKQLVELQNGKIHVESTPGIGSTFSFYIPYKKAEHKLPIKHDQENPLLFADDLLFLNERSVLFVDDSKLNLIFLKMMTSKWNLKFREASNGKQALAIIAKHKIDIVLTDIQMPEMDGYELLSAIRSLAEPFNRLPVIAVSGESGLESEKKLIKKGFSGLINKPVDEQILKQQLLKVIKSNLKDQLSKFNV